MTNGKNGLISMKIIKRLKLHIGVIVKIKKPPDNKENTLDEALESLFRTK